LALVETELWPNLIDQARQHQIAVMVLNARLSEKSAKGYARVAGLTRAMLSKIDILLAQDQSTRQRYIELGLAAQKALIVGNIKFDISAPIHFLEQAEQIQQQWQLAERQIVTLASTHAPEEQLLLEALREDLQNNPALLCIVVPRHPERFDEVFQLCQKLNLNTQRRSLGQNVQPDTQVYLADSMGELWLWYALSQVCFVGGSLNQPGADIIFWNRWRFMCRP
jgi:3-deoxy-D-manno-octulosonic-acid transferase